MAIRGANVGNKRPFGIRLDESIIIRLKKLAKKNKEKFILPNNSNSIIEQAIIEYLTKNEKRDWANFAMMIAENLDGAH